MYVINEKEKVQMKKKEIKNLAQKIAKCERIIQTSDDKKAIAQAEDEIM